HAVQRAMVLAVGENTRAQRPGTLEAVQGLATDLDIFFSSRRRHTRFSRDWSSDVCSSDLRAALVLPDGREEVFEGVMRGRLLRRSEERRVGKECRCRGAADAYETESRPAPVAVACGATCSGARDR